jgi:hypothetical protein
MRGGGKPTDQAGTGGKKKKKKGTIRATLFDVRWISQDRSWYLLGLISGGLFGLPGTPSPFFRISLPRLLRSANFAPPVTWPTLIALHTWRPVSFPACGRVRVRRRRRKCTRLGKGASASGTCSRIPGFGQRGCGRSSRKRAAGRRAAKQKGTVASQFCLTRALLVRLLGRLVPSIRSS